MATNGKRDLGKGLEQTKVEDDHWRIEGYDVYPFACWEGTHTSRGANISGTPVLDCPVGTEIAEGVVYLGDGTIQVANLSAARQWIRQQISREA